MGSDPAPSGRKWLIGAVLVLALLGGWRVSQVGSGNDSRAENRLDRPTPTPPPLDGSLTSQRPVSIPPGSSAVGNGVLMVIIPSRWVADVTSCERPVAYSVSYRAVAGATPPGQASSCPDPGAGDPDPRTAGVTLTTYRVQPARRLSNALPVGELGGKALLETSVTRSDGVFRQFLVMPADHLVVRVRSPSRRVVRAVSRSATEMPSGYRRVPPCIGLSADKAEATLAASGLKARTFSDPGSLGTLSLRVVTQAPSVGVIVPAASVVALGLIPQ